MCIVAPDSCLYQHPKILHITSSLSLFQFVVIFSVDKSRLSPIFCVNVKHRPVFVISTVQYYQMFLHIVDVSTPAWNHTGSALLTSYCVIKLPLRAFKSSAGQRWVICSTFKDHLNHVHRNWRTLFFSSVSGKHIPMCSAIWFILSYLILTQLIDVWSCQNFEVLIFIDSLLQPC